MHRCQPKTLRHFRPAFVRAALICGLSLTVCSVAAPASAADPAAAKKLMGEARAAAKTKDFETAIGKLREAAKHMDHPSIYFAQSRVLTYMLDLTSAEKALKKCSEFELPRKLQQAVAKQRAAIEALRGQHGHLVVKPTPADAKVFVVIGDERKAFDGGVDRFYKPGKVRVEVSADGYAPAVRPATLEAGQVAELKVPLKQLMGQVRVTVAGGLTGASLSLDGEPVELKDGQRAGDVATFDAPPGAHEVVCVRGKKRDSQVLKVVVNQTVAVQCDKLGGSMPVPRGAMGWGAVGVGAVLAGLGSYHIGGYFNDAEYAQSNGLIASKDRAYGGTAFLVSGVAIGVASYLLLVREPSAETSQSAWRFEEGGDGSVFDPHVQVPAL